MTRKKRRSVDVVATGTAYLCSFHTISLAAAVAVKKLSPLLNLEQLVHHYFLSLLKLCFLTGM
jgi:hypothetical protein